ncbi:MAG: hypothetical protein AAF992_25040 [Bacteroidota bacterium]
MINIEPLKRILIILYVGLATAITAFSQSAADSSSPELDQLYVHLDKSFYATGETLWYKVYFLYQDTSSVKSNIVYLDLISPTGEVLVHQKLLRDHLHTHGEINIPPDWEEGYYTLRCYTRWNLNFGDDAIYQQRIPIYNPYENLVSSASTPPVAQTVIKSNERDLNISLQTRQQVYGKNDDVQVTITVTDAAQQPVNANLSLAVLDTDLINLDENTTVAERQSFPDTSIDPVSLNYTPEEALALAMTVASPTTSELVSSQFISVYRVEDQEFINTSIEQGELSVSLPNFFGSRTFQIHNHNPFQAASPSVAVHSILDSLPSPKLLDSSPSRTPEVERYLRLSKLRNKLQEIFESSPPPSAGNTALQTNTFIPNKTYSIDKFQLMKTVEDFVSNVLVKASISSDDGQKSVRLFDPIDQRYLEDNPWYMINGYLTTLEEEVLAMSLSQIEKIDIFLQPKTVAQQFPFLMARGGVIAIYTKDKKPPTDFIAERNTFTWQGFHSPLPFEGQRRVESQDDKVPDFRPLVYWEPVIETDEQGRAVVTFPNSKAISQFSIQVSGVSVKGDYGEATTTYETQFAP